MTYKTLYSSAAKTDLKEAVLYISNELKNPTAANALLDAVNEELNTLSLFPYAHNIIANKFLSPYEFRFVKVKNYIAVYKVNETEKTIYIVRFLYNKRDWTEILKTI